MKRMQPSGHRVQPANVAGGYEGATRESKRAIVGKPSGVTSGKGKGYDGSSHDGHGKKQKLTPPAVGEGYNKATPGARQAVVGPPSGVTGGKGKGYNTEAHSNLHHGNEAVGGKEDFSYNKYEQATHSEGRGPLDGDGGPNFIKNFSHGTPNKAAHHPRSGEAHTFKQPMTDGAHGFKGTQKKGFLRCSGSSKAHRIGCR
jgi:hypothetical protein